MIKGVNINREKSINIIQDSSVKKVMGQSISSIERRAKYLLFHLQNKQILSSMVIWEYPPYPLDTKDRKIF
jgi:formamidopyrimidine-DNA glycosylase